VPSVWIPGIDTIEAVCLSWVDMLDKNLTKHEQSMKKNCGVAVLEIYRTWDIHKCRIDTLSGLQKLPPGTELEVVLENPHWARRKNYPAKSRMLHGPRPNMTMRPSPRTYQNSFKV